jgi:hypothetical protein
MTRSGLGLAGRFALVSATLVLVAGCVREYKPPTADEPHAVLKIRRTYESTPGVTLQERANIGEFRAFEVNGHALEARQARTDAILVHPVPMAFAFTGTFVHTEFRQVQETYYEQEPYSDTESYSCGTGTSYQSCTRSVTRYRSVPKTRWVTRQETIVDGTCEGSAGLSPAAGGVYLLQYTYQDRGACSLSCFEQVSLGENRFEQKPCPVGPPPPN